jgi:hypothetical protein
VKRSGAAVPEDRDLPEWNAPAFPPLEENERPRDGGVPFGGV